MERDLQASGYTFNDIGSERLPFTGFVAFVIHAPPGTAVFHSINKGVVTSDYLLAQILDVQRLLLWAKTEDGQNNINRPEPTWLPGMPEPEPEEPRFVMTVADYVEPKRMTRGG